MVQRTNFVRCTLLGVIDNAAATNVNAVGHQSLASITKQIA